jgi:N-acetylneuraminate synthase/N,N'-diacetyllegionaminate synthase
MARTTVIAEAGVNHNGDVARAMDLVHAAKHAGADIVKFQHFRADTIVAKGTATAAYQKTNTGTADQSDLLRGLEMELAAFARISELCRSIGIRFLCTAFDPDAAGELVAMGMPCVKIPSGELTNLPMLRDYARFKLPVLLSTGMGDADEVAEAIDALDGAGAPEITLLQCTSLYPAPPESLNLRAMTSMKERFGRAVGFSDHSLDDHAAIAAVALGATVIEKHFTLDRRLPGPDHTASLEPDELARMITRIHEVEAMLGDGVKRPAPGELDTARLVRRSWHAARDIEAGAVLGDGDVRLLRPTGGLPPRESVKGRRAVRAIAAGAPITAADLG